jgi:hypothetical protein
MFGYGGREGAILTLGYVVDHIILNYIKIENLGINLNALPPAPLLLPAPIAAVALPHDVPESRNWNCTGALAIRCREYPMTLIALNVLTSQF